MKLNTDKCRVFFASTQFTKHSCWSISVQLLHLCWMTHCVFCAQDWQEWHSVELRCNALTSGQTYVKFEGTHMRTIPPRRRMRAKIRNPNIHRWILSMSVCYSSCQKHTWRGCVFSSARDFFARWSTKSKEKERTKVDQDVGDFLNQKEQKKNLNLKKVEIWKCENLENWKSKM